MPASTPLQPSPPPRPETTRLFRFGISLAAVAMLILHTRHPEWLKSDALSIGLLIVAVIPWLFAIIEEAAFPGGWKIKFRQLEAKTDALEEEAKATRARLDHLIVSSMSDRLKKELRDFVNGRGGDVEFTDAYKRELSHLHNMGYIRFKDPEQGFDDLPEETDEVFTFFEITPLGKDYLALADSVAA